MEVSYEEFFCGGVLIAYTHIHKHIARIGIKSINKLAKKVKLEFRKKKK